jgi:beta-N-acetylhexosaminidase
MATEQAPSLELACKLLGQLFIVGFNGVELSDETSAFLAQANIGGVILFTANYESPGQVAELVNQVQECRNDDLPLWISIDHEGGRVQRFRKFFTRIPDAATVAAMDSPRLTFELAELVAKELKAVGVNVNFAPVADINTNPKNPVIGPRSYGSDEETVTKQITAVVRGHLVRKVQPCIKHFPGHGDTSTDSHFSLPKVDTDLKTMMEREFKPFNKAFRSHCSLVMTAHIICTKLDPDRPATLSGAIMTDLLRKQMRYTGLIITDDMEMKAITDHFGDEAPILAIEAGCDILTYRSEAAGRKAHTTVMKALESGRLSPEIIIATEKRIRALKKEVLLPYSPVIIAELAEKIGTPEHLALVEKIPEIQK